MNCGCLPQLNLIRSWGCLHQLDWTEFRLPTSTWLLLSWGCLSQIDLTGLRLPTSTWLITELKLLTSTWPDWVEAVYLNLTGLSWGHLPQFYFFRVEVAYLNLTGLSWGCPPQLDCFQVEVAYLNVVGRSWGCLPQLGGTELILPTSTWPGWVEAAHLNLTASKLRLPTST